MTTRTRTDVYRLRVKEMLTKAVVAVNADDTVQEVLRIMVENRVSGLPVVNAREVCVGMLSATDLMGVVRDLEEDVAQLREAEITPQTLIDHVAEQDFGRDRVHELMTEVVETIGPENTLVEAARAMLRHQVHRLPVVNDRQRLIGIISTTDIVAAFADGAPDQLPGKPVGCRWPYACRAQTDISSSSMTASGINSNFPVAFIEPVPKEYLHD